MGAIIVRVVFGGGLTCAGSIACLFLAPQQKSWRNFSEIAQKF
jgi:hypothetical protein